MEKLKIMCTGEILVDFHHLKDLQLTEDGRNLKATSQEKIDKLAKSLQQYGIVNNLQVWKDGEDIYCFDAHHRKKALSQLENEGLEIPLLPATRCLAETIEEAKKLLILKESSHSWVDVSVIEDYLAEINFNIKEAHGLIEIPDFEIDVKQTKSIGEKIPGLKQAIQLKPPREYIIVMCSDNEEKNEFEELKVLLDLKPVRRGGYKEGSPFDAVGTQRVIEAKYLIDQLKTSRENPE